MQTDFQSYSHKGEEEIIAYQLLLSDFFCMVIGMHVYPHLYEKDLTEPEV